MRLCRESGLYNGIDCVWPWFSETIKHLSLYEQNQPLLDAPKGCGYWAFKPIILEHQMHQMLDGEFCVYADAGIEFINNVSHIIERMDQDIFLFGNNWEHAHWCKRDVVEAVWPIDTSGGNPYFDFAGEHDEYDEWATWEQRLGKQCQASVIFFRISDYSRKFVVEWLKIGRAHV